RPARGHGFAPSRATGRKGARQAGGARALKRSSPRHARPPRRAHSPRARAHSASGFRMAGFIKEGHGEIWNLALATGPAPPAGWMLVEEVAEGGDVLAEHGRRDPAFTRGMTRVCEGGGVALYRRQSMQNAKFKMQTTPDGQPK